VGKTLVLLFAAVIFIYYLTH